MIHHLHDHHVYAPTPCLCLTGTSKETWCIVNITIYIVGWGHVYTFCGLCRDIVASLKVNIAWDNTQAVHNILSCVSVGSVLLWTVALAAAREEAQPAHLCSCRPNVDAGCCDVLL